MKRAMTLLAGTLLALGIAGPAAAQFVDNGGVVDYGDGIRWDFRPALEAKPGPGSGDSEYHRVQEPDKHIPPEAALAASVPGPAPTLSHERDQRMHQSQ